MLCLAFAACSSEKTTDYTEVTLTSPLQYDDQLKLSLAPDHDGQYDLWLKVGHTSDYAFENVYLKYHVVSGRDTLASEVKSFDLMDGGGLWKGMKTKVGYEQTSKIETLNLTANKSYEVVIEQYSRENPLDGIVALGVKLEEL